MSAGPASGPASMVDFPISIFLGKSTIEASIKASLAGRAGLLGEGVPPLGVRGVAASLKPFGQIAGVVLYRTSLAYIGRAYFFQPPVSQSPGANSQQGGGFPSS